MALKKNDKGALVKELQTLLVKQGYSVVVDGSFGKQTLDAVVQFQKDKGLKVDGYVGPTTWSALLGIGIIDQKINGVKCIKCKDITPVSTQGRVGVGSFKNSICGTFTYPSGVSVCSILVIEGATYGAYSCHYWEAQGNKPESVLYRLQDGTIGMMRCKTASELPIATVWAIGGMGLLDFYSPAAEGFNGRYADVRRKTDHNVIVVLPTDEIILALCENMNDTQINSWARSISAKYAILLDGGHLAAINSDRYAKRVKTPQGVIIQAIK